MQFPTRIPTVVGLLLIAAIVASLVFFFERIARIPSQASATVVPKNVTLTNVADSSFTLAWSTGSPATGAISVSSSGGFGSQVVFDDRDSTGHQNTYPTHSVTLRNAKSTTEYAVKILSNGKTFLDNDKPYSVRTGPLLTSPTNGLGPAYGTITTNDGQPATGALVVLSLDGGQTLSTLVTKTGTWLIPLNLARTIGLDSYIAPPERIGESVKVYYTDEETFALTDTLNDAPVPTMMIGKTYDFRKQQAKSTPSALAQTQTPQVLGVETVAAPNKNYTITITSPAQGSALPTNLPLVAGTGFPGKSVSVVLGITNPISGSTTIGGDGIWQFTPPSALSEGKQSVTITTTNGTGIPKALTNTFTILKSGTQVLGIATPSATATPTATPIASPTASLSAQPIPTSGTTLPTIMLILLGLGFLASGAVVFVK